MTHPSNTSVTAQFGAGEREEKTKLAYVKRWRTIVRLPEQYADEIVEALRAAPVSHTSVKDGGAVAARAQEFTPRDAWNELVHKDDRTSPEEYPGHCLISFEELQDFMSRDRGPEPEPTKEDFAKWARVWHDTCETILTLLDLPGSGSPQEMLAQVQAYVGTRPPAQAPEQPTGSDAVADGAREIAKDIEELLSVIEAVRGDRGVLRVSGTRGDSQDVGVVGVKPFGYLMRQAIAALRSAPVKAEIKPHRYIPDYEAANGDCAVCGHGSMRTWHVDADNVAPVKAVGSEALRLLAAEDARQEKLHELLETIREQIRLGIEPEHRPEGLFQNIQDAVYAMRGRTLLMNDVAITSALAHPGSGDAEPGAWRKRAVLSDDDVQWVVNDIAELGVKIGDQFFFLYKGRSLVYGDDAESRAAGVALNSDTDPPTRHMWRPVFKREFGECAHPINHGDYSKIGTVSLDDSDEWKPLPSSPLAALATPQAPAQTLQHPTGDGEGKSDNGRLS